MTRAGLGVVSMLGMAALSCARRSPLEDPGAPPPSLTYDFRLPLDAGVPREADAGTCVPLDDSRDPMCRLSPKRAAEIWCGLGLRVRMSERGDWLWANYADFSSAVWYGPDHKPIGCSTGSSMGGHACGGTRGAFDGSKGVDLCDRVARNGAQISIATSRTGVIRFGISPCDTLALPRGGGGWYDCPGQVDQLGLSLSEDGESCELSARIEPGTFGMLTVEGCAKPAVLEIYRRMFVQEARSLEWTDRSQR